MENTGRDEKWLKDEQNEGRNLESGGLRLVAKLKIIQKSAE